MKVHLLHNCIIVSNEIIDEKLLENGRLLFANDLLIPLFQLFITSVRKISIKKSLMWKNITTISGDFFLLTCEKHCVRLMKKKLSQVFIQRRKFNLATEEDQEQCDFSSFCENFFEVLHLLLLSIQKYWDLISNRYSNCYT